MKPDWKDAPEWASYLAKDASGQWVWHEEKPSPVGNEGLTHWNSMGRRQYTYTGWMSSLEERP